MPAKRTKKKHLQPHPPKRYESQVVALVRPEVKEEINQLAYERETSIGSIVREALRLGLEQMRQ